MRAIKTHSVLVGLILLSASGVANADRWEYYRDVYGNGRWGWTSHNYNSEASVMDAARMACRVGSTVRYIGNLTKGFTIPFKCRISGAGRTLQEYKKRVEDAYLRAVNAKKYATNHVRQLTDEQFTAINQLIDNYNTERRSAQSSQYSSHFSQYPNIAPIPSSWKAPKTVYTLEYRSASCSWCSWRKLNWTSTSLSVANQAKNWASQNYPQYSFRVAYQ